MAILSIGASSLRRTHSGPSKCRSGSRSSGLSRLDTARSNKTPYTTSPNRRSLTHSNHGHGRSRSRSRSRQANHQQFTMATASKLGCTDTRGPSTILSQSVRLGTALISLDPHKQRTLVVSNRRKTTGMHQATSQLRNRVLGRTDSPVMAHLNHRHSTNLRPSPILALRLTRGRSRRQHNPLNLTHGCSPSRNPR